MFPSEINAHYLTAICADNNVWKKSSNKNINKALIIYYITFFKGNLGK